jgi:predicted Ser/Thr protein kinase
VGIRRPIALSRAPSTESVESLEKVAGDPFAKNAEFVEALEACIASEPARAADAEGNIGRAGYALFARLLEVHAGAAPRSPDEAAAQEASAAAQKANSAAREASTADQEASVAPHATRVVQAARLFWEQVTGDDSAAREEIPGIVDRLIGVEVIQTMFRERYQLPEELKLDSCQLYRTGTTSAIFRCRWGAGEDVALKVTLARYMSVKALSLAFQQYSEDFHTPIEFSPRVYESGQRFIVLGFVKGETLEERLASLRGAKSDERTVETRVGEAFAVMLALTTALDQLADSGGKLQSRHHLDLTLNNVIVPDDGDFTKLKLIDFGQNQLFVEPIAASSTAVAKAAQYVAKELREGTIEESEAAYSAADAYSAGLLALETFAPGESQSINSKLDELWQRGAGLAAIIEDVLVDEPKQRLLLVSSTKRANPYSQLVKRLGKELEVQQEFGVELAPAGVLGYALRLIGRPGQIVRMYKVSRKFIGQETGYRRYRGLALWNALAMVAWLVIWATVLGLVMYRVGKGLHLGWIEGRGNELGEVFLQDFGHERFPRELWGRVVAFSFGLMAFTYYTNIYATITFSRTNLPSLKRKARLANRMARSLAIVAPAPCIVGAIVEPRIWPWATIFGVSWAAASNWAMANLHFQVREETAAMVKWDTDPSGQTRHAFGEWAVQMTTYAGGVAILALALHFFKHSQSFPVNNVGAYATVLTFLNLFFIVRLNCIADAPLMRGHLQRTAFNLRRLTDIEHREPDRAVSRAVL